MDAIAELWQHPEAVKVFISVGILVLIVTGRRLAVRTFENSGLPPERRNRFLVQSRNTAIVVSVASITVLWAEQLQTVALSLAAIAAALVIATKELILCLSGTLLRVSARSFRLGDRIEINGTRGDVIDLGPLTTTLLEVGPGPTIHRLTGRTVVIPNAVFLTQAVVNETFTEQFVLHTTSVFLPKDADWQASEVLLLACAREVCEEFVGDAQKNMERIGHKHGLEPPNVEPRVWVSAQQESVSLLLRFPAPIRQRGSVEQSILRAYMERRRVSPAKTDAAQLEA